MAGYRLAPKAARARRRPWQRRRIILGFTPGPAAISGSSSASSSASLALTANQLLSLSSAATASGTLDLTTTSATGSRAAPGWLGLFILDESGASVPLISGGSTATASGSLSVVTPARALISGSSTATATGTLVLRNGLATYIATPTKLSSAQFGNGSLRSNQFGNSSLVFADQHQIS